MRNVRQHAVPGWVRALAVVAAITWPSGGDAADYTKYHNYQELSAALKAAVAANPEVARIASIGRTREGRDLWVVEIANPAGVPIADRPALLVAANFEGDHLVGSEIALFVVEHLLQGYSKDPSIKQRLDTSVVYVIPRVNPDGAEQMFAAVRALRRTNQTPFDADNDGRMDEDGPDDLNKDGVITLMRVKDPEGPYRVSPDDPRLMKRADPAKGESGGWALYWEGIDNDGDGFYNEDGPGGADINRNFMHQYPSFQPDAGRYMVSEAETRAVLDFMLAHRNIAAILAFGESDNLIVAPARGGTLGAPNPITLLDLADRSHAEARSVGMFQDTGGFGGRGGGRGFAMMGGEMGPSGQRGGTAQAGGRGSAPARRPATTINAGDVEYFRTISEKYRELTGIRAAGVTRTPAGAFFEYGYYQFGVPSFSTPGWGLPSGPAARPGQVPMGAEALQRPAGGQLPAGMTGQRGRGGQMAAAGGDADGAAAEGIDQRLLQWMDAEKVDGFAPWTPFTHPTLGAVEIGGFKPYVTTNPPPAKLADLGEAHAKFALYLTTLFPKVRVAKAQATSLGAGLYRVTAEVENVGYLPTSLAHAVTSRAVKPTMVQLGVPPESIVTGADKTIYVPALAGSGGRQSFEWIVKAKPGTAVTLKVAAQKGGSDTASIKLQ